MCQGRCMGMASGMAYWNSPGIHCRQTREPELWLWCNTSPKPVSTINTVRSVNAPFVYLDNK